MTDAREDPWRLRTQIEASRERHASRRNELRTGAKRSRPIVDGVLHALPSAPPSPSPGELVEAHATTSQPVSLPPADPSSYYRRGRLGVVAAIVLVLLWVWIRQRRDKL